MSSAIASKIKKLSAEGFATHAAVLSFIAGIRGRGCKRGDNIGWLTGGSPVMDATAYPATKA
jgi:hypothetical protein